jgi:hypothetical protein
VKSFKPFAQRTPLKINLNISRATFGLTPVSVKSVIWASRPRARGHLVNHRRPLNALRDAPVQWYCSISGRATVERIGDATVVQSTKHAQHDCYSTHKDAIATRYHIDLKLYSPAYQAGLGCKPFNRRESFGSCQAQVHSCSFCLPFCHGNPLPSRLRRDVHTAAESDHCCDA